MENQVRKTNVSDRIEYNEESDASILMKLSMLIKPKLIKDDVGTWKPTRDAIQEGFLVHVTVSKCLNITLSF